MNKKLTNICSALATIVLLSGIGSTVAAQSVSYIPLFTVNGGPDYGEMVNGAGDVNGDGIGDVIVGNFSASINGTNSGNAQVLSGVDGSLIHNFDGVNRFDFFGSFVSGVGDVNGDGFADVMAGAPTEGDNPTAQVFSGADGSIIHNFAAPDSLGFSGNGIGDLNGDGVSDLLIGNPFSLPGGSVLIFSGSDGSQIRELRGVGSDLEAFGSSVDAAGDVNGDGVPDVVVSAPGTGFAFVYSGSDGSLLHSFEVNFDSRFFDALPVSGAGDVNGDGFADVIVGVPASGDGIAVVYSGSDGSILHEIPGPANGEFGMAVSGVGDVNGDGFADFLIGDPGDGISGSAQVFSGSDGSVLQRLTGAAAGDRFGTSASGVADINGDGFDDIIVGALGGDYIQVFVSVAVLPGCTLGDVNMNGVVDFNDIPEFVTVLLGNTFQCEADCDENGLINFDDIPAFVTILLGN